MKTKASATALLARFAIAAALTLSAGFSQAQEILVQDTRPVRFFIGGGLTAGGDRLVTARYLNGSDYSLHAGGLVQFHGGLEFRVAPDVTLALSVGYHVDSVDTYWGSTTFSRIPIEALAHVRVHPNVRVGGGARFALNPTLSSDGFAPAVDEDFRSSTGGVIEAEYLFNPRLGLKLRGVFERYKSEIGLPSVDGNHVGLILNFYF